MFSARSSDEEGEGFSVKSLRILPASKLRIGGMEKKVFKRAKKSESDFSKKYEAIWQKGPDVKFQNPDAWRKATTNNGSE